jgi:hypothetical protein
VWELDDYHKGPPLKLHELFDLEDGEVVWVVYYDFTSDGGREPKIDGPSRIEDQGDGFTWLLDEAGCEFAMEGEGDEECFDDGGDGSGEMRLYKAVLGKKNADIKIYKYELVPSDGASPVCVVQMPQGARVLKVASASVRGVLEPDGYPAPYDTEHIFLWAAVDPEAPMVDREFEVYPTRLTNLKPPVDELMHLDTVILHGGSLVFHVFERDPETASLLREAKALR